jgi:hypothetical protein
MRGDQASNYNQGVGAAQRSIRSRGAAFHGGASPVFCATWTHCKQALLSLRK